MSSPDRSRPPLRIAVLISGAGTTLVNLQEAIAAGRLPVRIALVVASRECGGVQRAAAGGLPVEIHQAKGSGSVEAYSRAVFQRLREEQVELVVLGGFLSRLDIPEDYENRVMNIHPALIPAFCGKGMHGRKVHEAVLERGCKVTGCTVHFCDNEYDHGPIILQRTVEVLDDDDPDFLAARVFAAECEAYPEAIALFAAGRLEIQDRRVRIRPIG